MNNHKPFSGQALVLRSIATALLLAACPPDLYAGKPQPGAATDNGVVLITQASAEAGGITNTDAPGFPVTIDRPGHYRLAGDLAVADNSLGAISITAAGVTLDLNGFNVTGPNACTQNADQSVTCSYTSGGNGIMGQTGASDLTVKNGNVTGFGGAGVTSFADHALVEQVRAEQHGGGGIVLSRESTVLHSIASRNGNNGIRLSSGIVTGSTASRNAYQGISGYENLLVIDSQSVRNQYWGVWVDPNGTGGIKGSLLNGNGSSGCGAHIVSLGDNVCNGILY